MDAAKSFVDTAQQKESKPAEKLLARILRNLSLHTMTRDRMAKEGLCSILASLIQHGDPEVREGGLEIICTSYVIRWLCTSDGGRLCVNP